VEGPIKLHAVASRERPAEQDCQAMRAIRDALTILSAIEDGALLDALPEFEEDRRRHQTGKSMLDLLRERLRRDFDEDAIANGRCRCAGTVREE